MSDFVRGAFAGFAIGGFVAAVVEANIFVVKTLLHFNLLAAETAWEMSKGVLRGRQERAADEGCLKVVVEIESES